MKHWMRTSLGITLAVGLWQVSADARFLDLKKQEQTPPSFVDPAQPPKLAPNPPSTTYNTEVGSSKSVSLRFENLSLISVLQNIQDETGILFSIDPSIETQPFSATIQADNWEAAVRELLKGFSRVEVWTDNLETSRVWLLSGNGFQPEDFKRNADIRLSKPAPIKQTKQKPRAHTAPALVPARVANFKMKTEDLPPHILFEPGVLTFLKSKGLTLPQNVKNMFGPNLEGLPANMPISPHILNDTIFKAFLKSRGIQAPQS